MEHRDSESVLEQSQMEMMMIKTEVEATATSPTLIDIEIMIDLKNLAQEPGLVQSVKSEPLLMKEGVLEGSGQDGNEQQFVQGASTPAGTDRLNEACGTSLDDLRNVKQELGDINIGPIVLQHMDIHYAVNKIPSAVAEINTNVDDYNEAMPGSGVKKEGPEDKLRGNKTIPRKYYRQTAVKFDHDVKFWLGQQKNLQQHLPHQHRVMSSNGYKCNTCGRTFHKAHLLSAHEELHQRNCNKKSSTTQSVIAGQSNQSQDEFVKAKQKPFDCDICGKGYCSKVALGFHINLHSSLGLYVCHICDAKFGAKSNLRNHLRTHIGEKPYHCGKCDTRFAYSSRLTTHMRVHTGEKPYQCETCHARFKLRGDLNTHARVHTGEKPYSCDTCDAKFARSCTLTKHMRVHTGEKPYQCDTCCAKFAARSGLTAHIIVHTNESPYQCDVCHARFRQKAGLNNHHMRTHTDKKPYQCKICKVRFIQKGDLTKHVRVHTGEKPYSCDTCSASFARNSTLTSHMRVHADENPFRCDMCAGKFSRRSGLTSHMRVHTGGKSYSCRRMMQDLHEVVP